MYSLVVILPVAGALPDRGICPELLARVNLEPPRAVDASRAWLRVDRKHALATLYDGDDPVALYTLGAADLPSNVRKVEGAPSRSEDLDGEDVARARREHPRADVGGEQRWMVEPRADDAVLVAPPM